MEVAWKLWNQKRFDFVMFVSAETPESLDANLAALSAKDRLNLPEQDTPDQRVQLHSVLNWFQEEANRNRWFLILDNIDSDEAQQAVYRYLPQLQNGNVLITSRLTRWKPGLATHELDVLDEGGAIDYLASILYPAHAPTSEECDALRKVAETLGRLPLALEIAAAFMQTEQVGPHDYLACWETERNFLLDYHDPASVQSPFSLMVCWQQSVDRLQPASRSFLRLTAWLAPEPFPVAFFALANKELEALVFQYCEEKGYSAPESIRVSGILADVAKYSLAKRQGEVFSVHRLLQEVTRQRIPEAQLQNNLDRLIQFYAAHLPSTEYDPAHWVTWQKLQPHLIDLFRHFESLSIGQDWLAYLKNQLGLFAFDKSDHATAEPLMRQALAIDQQAYGEDHPNVARDLNNLAQLLQATNWLKEAEPLMRKSLLIFGASLGAEHPNTHTVLDNYLILCRELGLSDDDVTRRLASSEDKN